MEYGAIDHTIIDKLQNEEESRVRLQGAEELNRCVFMRPLARYLESTWSIITWTYLVSCANFTATGASGT